MKKLFKYTVVLLILSYSVNVLGQEDVKIKKKDFKFRKVGFKEAWKSVKTGNKYFSKGIGTYTEALDEYLDAHKYNGNNPALNYKIGVCYLATNEFYKASDFLEAAYLADENITEDIHYFLGRAYHLNLQFDQAIDNYKAYFNNYPEKDIEEIKTKIEKLIQECRYGKEIIGQPERVMINNLGKRINSEFDDYNPVVHPNDSLLYFTSRRKDSKKDDRSPIDNKYLEEVFVSERAGDTWKKAEVIAKKLNSDNNESVLDISPDGKRIFFYSGGDGNGDILYSEFKKDKWKSPKRFSKDILSKDMESSFSISEDESEIYFVSNREGTIGGKDIFVSKKDTKGKWGDPVNLGPIINSPYNEEGVYLDPTSQKLYFSSRGQSSMGGYDVFVSERTPDGQWRKPENMGYPINSPNDDIFFKLANKPKHAFYSTVRQDGFGGMDIYKIIFLGEEKELLLSNENKLIAWDIEPRNDIFYYEPSGIHVDTAVYLVGKVMDIKTEDPLEGKIQIIDTEQSKIVATAISDKDGNYRIKLPKRKDYGVEVIVKDYLFYVKMVNITELPVVDGKITKDFLMEKVEVGTKVVLNNIFFETNSSKLKSSSFEELGRVVDFMNNNSSVKLEISGHTDNVGSYRANLRLSEARAKSVVDYLISQGIDKKRLEYKGYSFTQPIADNNTEEGRSKNRRVEFKVLSTD